MPPHLHFEEAEEKSVMLRLNDDDRLLLIELLGDLLLKEGVADNHDLNVFGLQIESVIDKLSEL